MARALFIAAFFFTMTPLLISLQWTLGKLGLPGWGFIASNYYRVLCALLRIRVHGEAADARLGDDGFEHARHVEFGAHDAARSIGQELQVGTGALRFFV